MDENVNESDGNPEIDSEVDDSNWQQQNRRNKRANKTPRTDYFVQGRTITSSSHGYSRMEKNITRHPSPQHTERMKKQNDNHEMSNFKDDQKNSCDDIQNLNVSNYNRNSKKNNEKEKDIQIIEKEYEQLHVSQHALKFAVENKLPPIKIQCEPQLKTQEEGSEIIKQFLKYIETNFRKLNPRYNQPLGFDHYMVVDSGELICFTNYIELFIYMCDINNYPNQLNNIKIKPILPTRLPARNAVILKFIDNKIKLDEVQMYVKENFKSVYGIEEMLGTITYRSRHIRVDLLSKEEYINILNSGKQQLLQQLKNNTHLLPPHVQFYIPQQFRDQKGNKVILNDKNDIKYQRRDRQEVLMNINNQDTNVWPNLKSNTPSAPTNNATPIWNSDLRQLQEEIHSLKQEYENQIKKLKLDSENQVKLMAQSWQLFNFQSKTQTDAIADIYMTLADVIPSIMNSMQNFNHILKDINKNITNDNERQQRDF
ncbi:unnamed protein product, partial [Rotaria magnacalcarata]